MPKVKTNSGAKKRFHVTGSGEVVYQKPYRRHILSKKSIKRKRALRIKGEIAPTHKKRILRLLRLK